MELLFAEKQSRVVVGVKYMYYLACFGDSLIQGFPFGNSASWIAHLETTQEISVSNYGLCGDCADDIFERMRYRPLPEHIKHLLFLGGANDVLQRVPEKFTMGVIKKMLAWCEARGYKLCIVLPLLSADAWLNRYLLNLRQEIQHQFGDTVYLLDLQPAIGFDEASLSKAYLDGVHPHAATYKAMGEYALPLLREWLSEDC